MGTNELHPHFVVVKLTLQSNQTMFSTCGEDDTNAELSMLTNMTNMLKISHQTMTDVTVMSFII